MMQAPALDHALSSRVVVVDDDPSVRQALVRLLRVAGYEAIAYGSADEFLRSPDADQPSCLILDVQMPGLTGLELQKVMLSMRRPNPIIFITAHYADDIRTRALEMGAAGVLEKPFNDEALLDLIQKAFEHS